MRPHYGKVGQRISCPLAALVMALLYPENPRNVVIANKVVSSFTGWIFVDAAALSPLPASETCITE